jgi:hypothetical protein
MDREIVKLTEDQISDLWDGIYFNDGDSHQIGEETFTRIKKINTSDKSDGPSWEFIVRRESDKKYFKFDVWDAGSHNGYIFSDGDNTLEEVFFTGLVMEQNFS